jgi:hypothetical protein
VLRLDLDYSGHEFIILRAIEIMLHQRGKQYVLLTGKLMVKLVFCVGRDMYSAKALLIDRAWKYNLNETK